jgi:hypothetical protein
VIERTEVGEFERRGGLDDVLCDAVAEVCGQQSEHRTHALAAGIEQVPTCRVGEGIRNVKLTLEVRIDPIQPCFDTVDETARTRAREDPFRETQLARDSGT